MTNSRIRNNRKSHMVIQLLRFKDENEQKVLKQLQFMFNILPSGSKHLDFFYPYKPGWIHVE
jgi:hypothetical protein